MIFEAAIGAATAVAVSALVRSIAEERRRRLEAARARTQREVGGQDRGLRVGDVVVHGAAEFWLESCLELSDGGRTLSLFRGVDTGRECWIAELERHASELAFLSETSELPDGPVPAELRVSGRHLALVLRGRMTVRARGPRLPAHDAHAEVVLLADAGGKVALMVEFGGSRPRLSLLGQSVPLPALDVLRGGDVKR